jgi:hypothetical protein
MKMLFKKITWYMNDYRNDTYWVSVYIDVRDAHFLENKQYVNIARNRILNSNNIQEHRGPWTQLENVKDIIVGSVGYQTSLIYHIMNNQPEVENIMSDNIIIMGSASFR